MITRSKARSIGAGIRNEAARISGTIIDLTCENEGADMVVPKKVARGRSFADIGNLPNPVEANTPLKRKTVARDNAGAAKETVAFKEESDRTAVGNALVKPATAGTVVAAPNKVAPKHKIVNDIRNAEDGEAKRKVVQNITAVGNGLVKPVTGVNMAAPHKTATKVVLNRVAVGNGLAKPANAVPIAAPRIIQQTGAIPKEPVKLPNVQRKKIAVGPIIIHHAPNMQVKVRLTGAIPKQRVNVPNQQGPILGAAHKIPNMYVPAQAGDPLLPAAGKAAPIAAAIGATAAALDRVQLNPNPATAQATNGFADVYYRQGLAAPDEPGLSIHPINVANGGWRQNPAPSLDESFKQFCNSSQMENERSSRRLSNNNYKRLLEMEDLRGIIANYEEFDCAICYVTIEVGDGVVLRDCIHSFCKDCLNRLIMTADSEEIRCPYTDDDYSCESLLQDREIRALLQPNEYDEFLAKTLRIAEGRTQNSFHCQTPNCQGWFVIEGDVIAFNCSICGAHNCIACKAIHAGMTCAQYQAQIRDAEGHTKTNEVLNNMIKSGEGMYCPQCQAFIIKPDGCDWVCCALCRLQICWATKQRRWGPKGEGDNSGGCQCKVGGKLCKPDCRNCH